MSRRKTADQLRLQGTYRGDRHNKTAVTGKSISIFLNPPKTIEPPESITDKAVKKKWRLHVRLLNELKILDQCDLAELENMYFSLQQINQTKKLLSELSITSKEYGAALDLFLKLSNHFSELSKKYFISPVSRNKITLDTLQVHKAADELEAKRNPLDALLQGKK